MQEISLSKKVKRPALIFQLQEGKKELSSIVFFNRKEPSKEEESAKKGASSIA